MAKAADFLEELKFDIEQARSSPQHYGRLIRMEHILGEPDNVMTFEEYKATRDRQRLEAAQAAYENVRSIFERAAAGGATFEAVE